MTTLLTLGGCVKCTHRSNGRYLKYLFGVKQGLGSAYYNVLKLTQLLPHLILRLLNYSTEVTIGDVVGILRVIPAVFIA